MKKTLLLALSLLLLNGCIKTSIVLPPEEEAVAFVTATLAPTKPGLIAPTQSPATVSPTLPAAGLTSAPNCQDAAVFLEDVSYPDNTRLKAGEKFTKKWKFQNTGDCNWTGYTAAFISGDRMQALDSIAVPDTKAKASVEISVDLVAPSSDGAYTSIFELRNAAGQVVPIGMERSFWVKILVGNGAIPESGSGAAFATFDPASSLQCPYSANAGYIQQLIDLINQARTDAQLSTLSVNSQLTAAAQMHSINMACGNYLSHNGPNGEHIGYALRAVGYPSASFAEIIAIFTPQDAMDQWRNDPGHWEIVMNPATQAIGVGYAYNASSDYGGYFTVDFGSP